MMAPRPVISKLWCLTVLFLLFAAPLGAQDEKVYRGFDGGMMLHTGYLSGTVAGGAH